MGCQKHTSINVWKAILKWKWNCHRFLENICATSNIIIQCKFWWLHQSHFRCNSPFYSEIHVNLTTLTVYMTDKLLFSMRQRMHDDYSNWIHFHCFPSDGEEKCAVRFVCHLTILRQSFLPLYVSLRPKIIIMLWNLLVASVWHPIIYLRQPLYSGPLGQAQFSTHNLTNKKED